MKNTLWIVLVMTVPWLILVGVIGKDWWVIVGGVVGILAIFFFWSKL